MIVAELLTRPVAWPKSPRVTFWEYYSIVGAEEDIRRFDFPMRNSNPRIVSPSLGRENGVVNVIGK